MARDAYEATKLKRFLTGLAASNRNFYYYPILAFIQHSEGITKKYIMKNSVEKNQENIERWMESVHQHTLLGKPYLDGEESLQQWFNEEPIAKNDEIDSD